MHRQLSLSDVARTRAQSHFVITQEPIATRPARPPRRGRLTLAATVLGIALGGLFDGIVFHQILQWHHLISSRVAIATVADLEVNTLADGLFHAATWILALVGVWMLWSASAERHRPGGGRVLAGGLVAGWGAFNLVEGVVDHYMLQIHHVRTGPDQALYDAVFLAWGAVMLVVGWLLVRSGRTRADEGSGTQRR
jgi:uncharacterized membrane protein